MIGEKKSSLAIDIERSASVYLHHRKRRQPNLTGDTMQTATLIKAFDVATGDYIRFADTPRSVRVISVEEFDGCIEIHGRDIYSMRNVILVVNPDQDFILSDLKI